MASCAVVLAAGSGTRLNNQIPKWLLTIGKHTIADQHLAALKDVPNVVIVVGYKALEVRAAISDMDLSRNMTLSYVENPHFAARNNWYSALLGLRAGMKSMRGDQDRIVLLNSDLFASHRWLRGALSQVIGNDSALSLACDPHVEDSPEAMRVQTASGLVPGQIHHIGKDVVGVAEFVGLMSATKLGCTSLVGALERFESSLDSKDSWYEDAITQICDQVSVEAVPVPSSRWIEIDTFDDLVRARQHHSNRDY